MVAEINVNELEVRIKTAKRFLNSEITQFKLSANDSVAGLNHLGSQLDRIHEIERVGIRRINDLQFSRISRLLTSVEARMNMSTN